MKNLLSIFVSSPEWKFLILAFPFLGDQRWAGWRPSAEPRLHLSIYLSIYNQSHTHTPIPTRICIYSHEEPVVYLQAISGGLGGDPALNRAYAAADAAAASPGELAPLARFWSDRAAAASKRAAEDVWVRHIHRRLIYKEHTSTHAEGADPSAGVGPGRLALRNKPHPQHSIIYSQYQREFECYY